MDCYIWRAPNRRIFRSENWFESDKVHEMFYSRKCWDLVNHCSFIPRDYENGDFLELSYENLEEMIEVACKYPNYWGDYKDVPKLCELRDEFENIEEQGEHLYLSYDW